MGLGIIGCGNMGGAMARHLAESGLSPLCFDPDPGTRADLAASGLRVTDARHDLSGCKTILLSLPNAAIVETVMEDLLPLLQAGSRILDTSTSLPDTSRRMQAACKARGIDFIDGPVSGGPAAARSGGMTMLLGGDGAAIERLRPLLDHLTAKRVHLGGPGAGHAAKIINNMLCAANLVLVAEATRLGAAAGVDPAALLEGINAGSGRSAVSEVNFPRWVLSEAFDSGFTMGLMRKDVRLAQDLAAELGVALPGFAPLAGIWGASADRLGDEQDFNRITQFSPQEGSQ